MENSYHRTGNSALCNVDHGNKTRTQSYTDVINLIASVLQTELTNSGAWNPKHTNQILKVERWAEWGCFHDYNFILKYCFDMQPYWKFYKLIFEGKMGFKLNFDLKLLLNTYLADKL